MKMNILAKTLSVPIKPSDALQKPLALGKSIQDLMKYTDCIEAELNTLRLQIEKGLTGDELSNVTRDARPFLPPKPLHKDPFLL